MITLADLKKEIKRQAKKGNVNLLGFVENKEMSSEMQEKYFKCFEGRNGTSFYNWISGNNNLKQLIKEAQAK